MSSRPHAFPMVRWLLPFLLLSGCGASVVHSGPKERLAAYAEALREQRLADAYALLSAEAKVALPYPAFERLMKENPEEVAELARLLARPGGEPAVTATIDTPSGEQLTLVLEGGEWRVGANAIDLYAQDTPKAAIRAFLRAYANQRWDVLLRFVPAAKAAGLTQAQLKKAWLGEQRSELERITQALSAAIATATIERVGDRATLAYGAGGTVELLLEGGAWKIEDFK